MTARNSEFWEQCDSCKYGNMHYCLNKECEECKNHQSGKKAFCACGDKPTKEEEKAGKCSYYIPG